MIGQKSLKLPLFFSQGSTQCGRTGIGKLRPAFVDEYLQVDEDLRYGQGHIVLRHKVKLPALPRRASAAKPSETTSKPTRLPPTGYVAVACRHFSPCFRTGHPGEGEGKTSSMERDYFLTAFHFRSMRSQ